MRVHKCMRAVWLIGLLAALSGCASLEERVGEKIEYILLAQQAQPGDVIEFNFILPPEVVTGRVTFLKRTVSVFPRKKLEEKNIHGAFLPVPLQTAAGEYSLICNFSVKGGRREIQEKFAFPIVARTSLPKIESVKNKAFNPTRYDQELQNLAVLASQSSFPAERLQDFNLPLSGQIRASYGQLRVYNSSRPMAIEGIEIEPLAHGNTWDVVAAGEGKVVFAKKMLMLGNVILIDHGFSMMSLYAHLHSLAVGEGQRIERGSKIGRAGKTGGAAVGNRLRFQFYISGVPVDVKKYMDIVTH